MTLKILKSCLVFFLAFFSLTASVHAEVGDRIAAIVNNEIITIFDLNNGLKSYRKRIESYTGTDKEALIAEAGGAILNKLIDGLLIEQEAKKAGIVIKDEEVMNAIEDLFAKRNIKKEDFIEILAKEGSSFDAYKKEIKEQMTRVRVIRRELKAKVTVSEDEIGDYYRKHRGDYEGRETVRIKQIFIPIPKGSDQETKAKIKATAEMIRKQINTAESFDLAAVTYSAGPAAGDTGFLGRGMMLPAVEAVAFGLTKDEISGVIESPIGFHIIRIIDKRGAGIKPLESVREEIREKIENEKMEKKYEEWIIELRKKSHIDIKL